MWDGACALGKAYLELGGETAVLRIYRQLLENFRDASFHCCTRLRWNACFKSSQLANRNQRNDRETWMESVKSFILDVFVVVVIFFFFSFIASTVLYVIAFLCSLFYHLFLAPKCSNCAKRVGEETLRCPRCGSLLKEELPQEEMNPELYARVKTLVMKQTGFVSEEKLTPETHLADDLGVAGDDGYELLETFCEEFEIQNMSEIEPSKYFGTEGGPNPFFIYVFFYDLLFARNKLKDTDSSAPLYLRDLIKSAEARKWIPPEAKGN